MVSKSLPKDGRANGDTCRHIADAAHTGPKEPDVHRAAAYWGVLHNLFEDAPGFNRLLAAITALGQSVIIIDWDDTLCPTTWAMRLGSTDLLECAPGALDASKVPGRRLYQTQQSMRGAAFPPSQRASQPGTWLSRPRAKRSW